MKSTQKPDPTDTSKGDGMPPPDPEFNDNLGPSIDPAGQDFRDELQVTEALDTVGVVQGIDAELKDQQRQVEEDTLEVLEAMRALDHGGTVKWRITRVGTGDPTLDGFLDTWPTKLVTLERIRDKMGGGTFYLKGFRNGKYWVHKTVEIAGVPKVYEHQDAAAGGGGGVQHNQATGGFDIAAFLAQQEARDGQRRRELAAERAQEKKDREEREERDRKSRNELLAIVMPVLGTIATGITAAFTGPRSSPMADIAALMTAMKGPDPITVLTQLKALEGRGNQDTLSKILPTLLDMASDRASGGDTGWMDVVKELVKSAGPTVGAMIEHSVNQANAARTLEHSVTGPAVNGSIPSVSASHSHPALPAPPPSMIVVPESVSRRDRRTPSVSDVSAAGLPDSSTIHGAAPSASTVGASSRRRIAAKPSGGSEMNLMALLPHLPWLKEQLSRCLKAAIAGRDPELYAALFVEELPQGIEPATVVGLLSRPDWYTQLVQLDERLNNADLVPWFTRMMQGVLHSMAQEAQIPEERVQTGQTAQSAQTTAAPKKTTTEIQRPTQIPSLTGEH